MYLYQLVPGQKIFLYQSRLPKIACPIESVAYWVPKRYWGTQKTSQVVKLCCDIFFSRYFVAILFTFIFMQMKKHATKRSINIISLVSYMFIKTDENLRLTIYKIEIVHAWWQTFSRVPNRNVSSKQEPEFLEACDSSRSILFYRNSYGHY